MIQAFPQMSLHQPLAIATTINNLLIIISDPTQFASVKIIQAGVWYANLDEEFFALLTLKYECSSIWTKMHRLLKITTLKSAPWLMVTHNSED